MGSWLGSWDSKVGYHPLVGNENKKWDWETSLLLDVKLKFEL